MLLILYVYLPINLPPKCRKYGEMMHEHFSLSSWKVITKINVLFAFFLPPSQVRTSVLPDHKEPRADAGVSNFLKIILVFL